MPTKEELLEAKESIVLGIFGVMVAFKDDLQKSALLCKPFLHAYLSLGFDADELIKDMASMAGDFVDFCIKESIKETTIS